MKLYTVKVALIPFICPNVTAGMTCLWFHGKVGFCCIPLHNQVCITLCSCHIALVYTYDQSSAQQLCSAFICTCIYLYKVSVCNSFWSEIKRMEDVDICDLWQLSSRRFCLWIVCYSVRLTPKQSAFNQWSGSPQNAHSRDAYIIWHILCATVSCRDEGVSLHGA